jgi:hypothetical protein
MHKRMTTKQAAAYLTEMGIKVTPGTLEVFRCKGKGPRYRKVDERVFYIKPDLDEYGGGRVVETRDSLEIT